MKELSEKMNEIIEEWNELGKMIEKTGKKVIESKEYREMPDEEKEEIEKMIEKMKGRE